MFDELTLPLYINVVMSNNGVVTLFLFILSHNPHNVTINYRIQVIMYVLCRISSTWTTWPDII